MWPAAELLVVAWIAVGGWLALRGGGAAAVTRLGGVALAYLTAATVAWIVHAVTATALPNPLLRWTVPVLVAVAVSAMVWRRWRAAPSIAAWRERMRAALPPTASRSVVATLALVWIGAHVALWTLLVNVVGAAGGAGAIRGRALLSGMLLSPSLEADGADRAQQRLLGRLRLGFAGSVDGLLDASGARQVMDTLDALRLIVRLDVEERGRLIASIPELQRLSEHEGLAAIAADERLMLEVDAAAAGSLAAAYRLGDDPRVQALFDDPAVRDAMRAIDPPMLRARLRSAGATEAPPLRWRLGTLASSLALDRRLADDDGWLDADGSALVWPGAERFAIARARLDGATTVRALRVGTPAAVSCWLDGRPAPPRGDGDAQVVDLPAGDGSEAVLLLDFGGIDGARACTVSVMDAR